MSIIASPRASSNIQSPSSSRSSLSLDPQAIPPSAQRRNRSALRDYYGLKASAPSDTNIQAPGEDALPPSDLDRPGFDASSYVADVLSKESLEGVLRVEAGLVSEVRGLNGERKALVYDNYSKLIAATDTIRSMRTNMDPLTPMTTTLEPALAHIAQTASSLNEDLKQKDGAGRAQSTGTPVAEDPKLETVRWVLDSPRRLRSLLQDGQKTEAEADWAEIRTVLNDWQGVAGVDEVRRQCEESMAG